MNNEQIIDYEKCYLGSLLINAAENKKIETCLQADDFFIQENGQIFTAFFLQQSNGITPDIITLTKALSNNVAASTIAILPSLNKVLPSGANINFYENEIYKASKDRLLQKVLNEAIKQISDHTEINTVINNLLSKLSEINFSRKEKKIYTTAELLLMNFPPMKWIIPGLIGEGLTMLCGVPKIGKSWFVLNLAIAAASGGSFLGKPQAQKTNTLYLALEDTERRLQDRIKIMKRDSTRELNGLIITTQWRYSYIGLENYLKAHKDIGLVIIDTLARFSNIEDMNNYTMTTNAIAKLKQIADDLKIAIVFVHHAKKPGSITEKSDWLEAALGSTGLTGTADSTIFISKYRTQKETKNSATLYITGRDVADDKHELKFDLDCGGWTIIKERTPRKNTDNIENNTESTGLGFNWKNMV